MKIIIEGCDGTGKSTLAKILADRYGLDICHCTQDDPGDYEFYRQTLRKENVIWDRHTIGELIYPKIFGRKQKIGVEDARLLMHHAKEGGVKVLVLTADVVSILDRIDARGNEDERVYDNLAKINYLFKKYARKFHLPLIDTSKMTLEDIFNLIEEKETTNYGKETDL